jgi:hypothetical protein
MARRWWQQWWNGGPAVMAAVVERWCHELKFCYLLFFKLQNKYQIGEYQFDISGISN